MNRCAYLKSLLQQLVFSIFYPIHFPFYSNLPFINFQKFSTSLIIPTPRLLDTLEYLSCENRPFPYINHCPKLVAACTLFSIVTVQADTSYSSH